MIDSSGVALLVIAGIVAATMLLRRHRAAAPEGIRVLGRTALHKGAVVAVIAVGDTRMVVGAGDHGVQLLTVLPSTGDGAHGDGAHGDLQDVEAAVPTGTATTYTTTTDLDGGMDALVAGADLDVALAALSAPRATPTTAGPGIGLVDRLRELTVRTPTPGRPSRVFHRR